MINIMIRYPNPPPIKALISVMPFRFKSPSNVEVLTSKFESIRFVFTGRNPQFLQTLLGVAYPERHSSSLSSIAKYFGASLVYKKELSATSVEIVTTRECRAARNNSFFRVESFADSNVNIVKMDEGHPLGNQKFVSEIITLVQEADDPLFVIVQLGQKGDKHYHTDQSE